MGTGISDASLLLLVIICTMCVCTWVTQFSLKLLQLHIFGKLLVLMNFYTFFFFFFFFGGGGGGGGGGFAELWPTFE